MHSVCARPCKDSCNAVRGLTRLLTRLLARPYKDRRKYRLRMVEAWLYSSPSSVKRMGFP